MIFLSYFNDSANFPFSVALLIVTILAAIEGVGLLIGAGIFGFLDGLLPDIDLDIDIDAPDLSSSSISGQVLTWLRIGKVPVIFSLIVFLVAFGLIGLSIQGIISSIFGSPLPAVLACIPTFIISLPILSASNVVLSAIIPRDETSAVSQDSLIGKLATITLGQARKDSPAQAKVKDEHNQTHYIMLAPDTDGECYSAGDKLLLVRREKTTYFGIVSNSEGLSD